MPFWQIIVIGFTALIIVVGAGSLWWWVPKWQMRSITAGNPKDRADIEDNFRKTVGQALGGLAVLIGAAFAYFQFLQQQRGSHDLLISQQILKGFEDLGHEKEIMTRLGGIYALEGVMNDPNRPNRYHLSVLQTLCAFVRDGTKTHNSEDPPAVDIQAALDVIGRRDPDEGGVNLTGARIPKARLRGADLAYAGLAGADLRGADLTYAHLRGANLSNADLTGAKLIEADLRPAEIEMQPHLTNANLTDANLTDANISQDDLNAACGARIKLKLLALFLTEQHP